MAYGTRKFNIAFKDSQVIPNPSLINPIPRIDICLIKINSAFLPVTTLKAWAEEDV
jgi:hypothetical protein